MDIVAKLREEAFSEHALYTEFILKLKGNTDQMICFFEGKDDYKYYGIRIENICQREFEHIPCNGKENVLAVKRLIEQQHEYKSLYLGYFVDMDYAERINIDKVYCTPSYSIENQYANSYTFRKVVQNEFSLDSDDPDFSTAEALFEESITAFHNQVKFINAWLACQADKRSKENPTYLNIDSTIGRYFSNIVKQNFEIGNLNDLNSLDSLGALFPNAPSISTEELNSKFELLQGCDPTYFFRGKFQLAFFTSFLDRLKSEICKKDSQIFTKKHKCNLRFEHATALTSLSIYAQTPICLIDFLTNRFRKVA